VDCGLSGQDLVCFAGEDWWYHHPHSKNHILKRLAKQNKVLFVNSISMGLPAFASSDYLLKIKRKARSYLRWLRYATDGLYVMTPLSFPFYGSRWARKFNGYQLALQVQIAMKLCGMTDPILWVAIPTAADAVEVLKSRLLLYHVSDKYDVNEDSILSRRVIRELDERLRSAAAVVMYSGRKLFEEADPSKRFFLEQAVDFDHFATHGEETAPEMARIPGPVLGYFGAMDYVMDPALVAEVARRRPQWHWVFIGLRSNFFQVVAPNVHFLGSKPYLELPKYVTRFDVCVLPWRQDHAFTSYGSAIKVREYLATGKPVVISPLYEYQQTPGVRFYRNVDEFIAVVEDALEHDTTADRELRQSVVRSCTWDARAREVGKLIHSLLEGGATRNSLNGTELSRCASA